jgi:cell wall assembly regulator SMI1
MNPIEIIQSVQNKEFENEDGLTYTLELEEGLSQNELERFEARFPRPLPQEIRALLQFTRGFQFRPVDIVSFTGEHSYAHKEIFPLGVSVCGDGFGNFWVVEVSPRTGEWGEVFFDCHDPPVVVYQAASLTEFLEEVFKLGELERESCVDYVHEEVCFKIWEENPGVITVKEASQLPDRLLNEFSEQFQDRDYIVDLRNGKIGLGLSWGRYGPNTRVVRHEVELVFGVKVPEKKGWFKWFLEG